MYHIVDLADGSVVITESKEKLNNYLEAWDDYVITYIEEDDEGNLVISEVNEDGSFDQIDPE